MSGFKTGSFRFVEMGGGASGWLEVRVHDFVGGSSCKLRAGTFDGNTDGNAP